jgi:putative flippase GtrA
VEPPSPADASPLSGGVTSDAPEVSPKRKTSAIKLLGKHQLSSIVATIVDYSVMITMVSVLGLTAVEGTVIGASSGAITNFTMGRHFTFRATRGNARSQLLRYLLVSAASLGWNALGEHLLANILGLQYVVARLITGTLVGFVWNFPMQRYFVFR